MEISVRPIKLEDYPDIKDYLFVQSEVDEVRKQITGAISFSDVLRCNSSKLSFTCFFQFVNLRQLKNENQQALFIDEVLRELYKNKTNVFGINYNVLTVGTTKLLNDDGDRSAGCGSD